MKKNKLSKKKIIILAVAAAVVAGGLWYFLSPDEVSVAAEKVKRGEFSDSFKENGTYTTGKNADVISEAGGNIVAVSVQAGTQVKQGDVIAVLDGSDYENEKSSHENLARSYLAEADNADKTEKDTKQDNVNAFEIEMKTAKNTLDTAEKNYGDSKQLYDSGVIAESAFDDIRTEYENAKLAWQKAKDNYETAKERLGELKTTGASGAQKSGDGAEHSLMAESYRALAESENRNAEIAAKKLENCTIKAPCAGIVTDLPIEQVTRISEGEKVAAIRTEDGAGIECSVLTTYEPYLKTGDPVSIVQKLKGGNVSYPGHISEIYDYAEKTTSALGTDESRVKVKVAFDGETAAMKNGYELEVEFFAYQPAQEVISVPNSAVFKEGDQSFVFTVAGGKARKTQIEPGHKGSSRTEVLSGLAEADTVVINCNNQDLEDGVSVSAE